MKNPFLSSFVLSVLTLSSCSTQPLEITQDTTQHLFFAEELEGGSIRLSLYDLTGIENPITYDVSLPDLHAYSRFENGGNDAVQYDSNSGLFFFATRGTGEMEGVCINADGTCSGRLYEWEPGDETPTLFWDSEGEISGWLVDSERQILWVNVLSDIFKEDIDGKSLPLLLGLDMKTGTEVARYELRSSGPLAMTPQGTIGMYLDGGGSGGLAVSQVDTYSDAESTFIEFGSIGENTHAGLSGLSPDQSHFVTFTSKSEITLYPMEMDAIGQSIAFDHDIKNFNLYWSADSTHFAAQSREGIVIYSLDGDEENSIGLSHDRLILWAPSSRYLLLNGNRSEDLTLILYDLETETETPIKEFSSHSLGALFY